MGRSIRTVAVWIAERGGKVFLLEQLLGSDTLSDLLITLGMLRAFNSYVTLILISLWSLSPIGSQSTLRVLSIGSQSVTGTSSIFSLDTSPLAGKSVLATPNLSVFMSSFSAIYSASLISPVSIQQGPVDDWGNVKIPLLELLNGSMVEDWIQTPAMQTTPYSSLLGNPIAGIPVVGNSTFETFSSYFFLECTKPVLVNFDLEFHWGNPEDSGACSNLSGSWILGGDRLVNNTARGTCSLGSLDDNGGQPLNQTSQASKPTSRTIMFQSMSQNGIAVTNCSVSFPTVESRISCSDGNCIVTAMRPYSSTTSSLITPLDDCETANNFYNQFAQGCGPYRTTFAAGPLLSEPIPLSSLSEGYLMIDASPAAAGRPVEAQVDLSNLTQREMSERLTRVFNTFWMASLAPEYIAGGMASFNFSDSSTLTDHPGTLINATVITYNDTFVCSTTWFIFIFFSSGVLLLVCGVGSWLQHKVLAPDIFQHISSLARDNPYIQVDAVAGGNTLDGWEKARALKNVIVKLGDVQPYGNVGHIALAASDGTIEIGSLRKGRLYA
jgi:hypothetical protein